MNHNQYNFVSSFYDDLAGLIFGKPLFDAQLLFFDDIPSNSNVLIMGGGTGWFLPILFKHQPSIKVWYVDASEKMIYKAQKQLYPKQQVQFICGALESIPNHVFFDVVILPFFLDGFLFNPLKHVLKSIQLSTHKKALWVVTDFYEPQRKVERFTLWLTHQTLGRVVKNPNKTLVPWWKAFEELKFSIVKQETLNNHLFTSVIYSLN